MIPEQEVIQKIKEQIQSGAHERTPVLEDLADHYAELCEMANIRLLKCLDFLDKGMRSEAAHEANVTPTLMELIQTLSFNELPRWQGVCRQLQLTEPTKVEFESVNRLKEELKKEEELKPLLKEYRRLVYQADHDASIRVLREIRSKDSDNKVWAENLAPLEEQQMPELIRQIKEALEDEDLPRLRELHREITHPYRTCQLPQDIVDNVKGILADYLLEEKAEDADEIVKDLKKQLDAGELQEVEALLNKWNEVIESDENFTPRPTLTGEVERAGNWVKLKHKEIERRKSFDKEVDSMRELLGESPLNMRKINNQWSKVKSFGYPVQSAVENRVNEVIKNAERKKRSRIIMSVVLLVILLSGGISTYFYLSHKRMIEDQKTARFDNLQQMVENKRYEDAQAELTRMSADDSALYFSPAVTELKNKVEDVLKNRKKMQADFESLMDRLYVLKADSYSASTETINEIVAEAEKLGKLTDNGEKVENWVLQWKTFLRKKRAAANKVLNEAVAKIRMELDRKNAGAFESVSDEIEAVNTLLRMAVEVEMNAPEADKEVVEIFATYKQKLYDWQNACSKKLNDNKMAETEKLQLRAKLVTCLPNLAVYQKTLTELNTKFSDMPDSNELKQTAISLPAWSRAAALADFSIKTLPLSPENAVKLYGWTGKGASSLLNSVWEKDLDRVKVYQDALDKIKQKIPPLLIADEKMSRLQVMYYRTTGSEKWLPLYSLKGFNWRSAQTPDGTPYEQYWGEVYWFRGPHDVPWLEHTNTCFSDNITTLTYDVRVQKKQQDNLVPHAKFLMKFVANASVAEKPDEYMLDNLELLLRDETMEVVPRAWLIKRIVYILDDVFGKQMPYIDNMKKAIDQVNTDAPWINTSHPESLRATSAFVQAKQSFPDIDMVRKELTRYREIIAAIVSRQVQVVGVILRNENGKLQVYPTGTITDVAWILPKGATKFVHGVRLDPDGGLYIFSNVQEYVHSGMLIFAPKTGSGKDRKIMQGLFGDKEPPASLVPAAWPGK